MDYLKQSSLNMHIYVLLYVILFDVVINGQIHVNTSQWHEQQLHKHIFDIGNRDIRPVYDSKETVDVKLRFVLMGIGGVDEQNQVLSSTLTIVIDWNCDTLSWNPQMYGDAEYMLVYTDSLWTPHIFVRNKLIMNMVESREKAAVSISYLGGCKKTIAESLQTRCYIDISKYPFDSQTCYINVTQTFYSTEQQNLSLALKGRPSGLYMFDENPEWTVINTDVVRYLPPERFSQPIIAFTIILQRKYAFYIFHLVVPVIVLPFMTVFTFLVPVGSGERLGYCVAMLLSFIVLLQIVADSVPRVSSPISFLQIYINVQLGLATLATVLSIILSHASHRMQRNNDCVYVKLVSKCCTRKNKVDQLKTKKPPMELNGDVSEEAKDDGNTFSVDVEEAMDGVNIVFFGIFLFIYVAMTCALLVVLLQ